MTVMVPGGALVFLFSCDRPAAAAQQTGLRCKWLPNALAVPKLRLHAAFGHAYEACGRRWALARVRRLFVGREAERRRAILANK